MRYYINILAGKKNFRVFLAAFILSLIVAVRPSLIVFKDVYPLVQNLDSKVNAIFDEVYPDDLEITIKNGNVSTNVTEPYYLTLRESTLESLLSFKKDNPVSTAKVRILAIDTKGKAEDFERYQAFALLTQTSVVYYQDGKVSIQSLRGVQNITVNKELIRSKINEYNQGNRIGNFVRYFVLASPLVLVFFGVLGQLLKFFLISLLVLLMVKINKLQISFKNVFRYTAALIFTIMLLANLASFTPKVAKNILAIESVLTAVILGLAYAGMMAAYKNGALGTISLPDKTAALPSSLPVGLPISTKEAVVPEMPLVAAKPVDANLPPPSTVNPSPVTVVGTEIPAKKNNETFSTLLGHIKPEDVLPEEPEKKYETGEINE